MRAIHTLDDAASGLLALRAAPDRYRLTGGRADEGAVIVSLTGKPVAFPTSSPAGSPTSYRSTAPRTRCAP
ncbi:hypothetical protein [Streptomyces sp. NPDC053560]|uniref:hypothetical protein n=1 Tax=Streptomyces sp. NPDC053560 TaxID=3365711 RepID=UPI0037CF6754